jgi:2-polyprenyl-3-methyl-5-hydroxy-6-metoxy-1,4-benzoquinol methylase
MALECRVDLEENNDIEKGALDCAGCGLSYPIVRGIPRFVTLERPLSGQNVATAAAFGWEWQEFTELHDLDTYKAQFLDWVAPLQPEFLQGKVVLDAGCGMGRFARVSGHFGARAVLAIDASGAVEAARQNTRECDNVHVIQGDIHHLPLRRNAAAQMEFIFSIGVLHHLDNPQAGFQALANHLHQEGSLFAWVYGRENNGWLINVVNPIRTALTSRLPRRALYTLSWLVTAGLHPVVRYIYRPANITNALRPLRRLLPYNDYLAWLGQFGFRHNHHVVFDHLVAPVAFYLRRDEFAAWFSDSGLEILEISWRNQNSWRGHGRLAQA